MNEVLGSSATEVTDEVIATDSEPVETVLVVERPCLSWVAASMSEFRARRSGQGQTQPILGPSLSGVIVETSIDLPRDICGDPFKGPVSDR